MKVEIRSLPQELHDSLRQETYHAMNLLLRGQFWWDDEGNFEGCPSNFIAYRELADKPPYIKTTQVEAWLAQAYYICDKYELWGFVHPNDEIRYSNSYSWMEYIRQLLAHFSDNYYEQFPEFPKPISRDEWFANQFNMTHDTRTYTFGEWEKHVTEVAEYLFKPIMKEMIRECISHCAQEAEKLVAWVVTNVKEFDITKPEIRERFGSSRDSNFFVSLNNEDNFAFFEIPRKEPTKEGLRLFYDPETGENVSVIVEESPHPEKEVLCPFYVYASFGRVFWP